MNVHDLLQKDMTRKEFLRMIGVGLLAIGGINSILKAFEHTPKNRQKAGYGVSAYGR